MLRKNRIAAVAVAGVAATLLVGSLVIGSNMGFKLNKELEAAGIDQWIAVPVTGPYAVADDLLNMVLSGDGTITRFVPSSPPGFQFWTGSLGDNFPLLPGEGYQFRAGATSGASTIIVGAHDPNQGVPAGGWLAGVDNLLSPPYHTTATVADDLLGDMPGGTGTITRLVPGVTPGFQFWTGSLGDNFAIEIGEAYLMRAVSPAPGSLFSHF